jgi:hypothetical protein
MHIAIKKKQSFIKYKLKKDHDHNKFPKKCIQTDETTRTSFLEAICHAWSIHVKLHFLDFPNTVYVIQIVYNKYNNCISFV